MTTGRKPSPTALKIVKGNQGNSRPSNKNEAILPVTQPKPPAFLNADATAEWTRVCKALFGAGLMTELDMASLSAYCQAYGVWAQAERAIAKLQEGGDVNGLLMKTTNGNVIQHALIGIANKARGDVVRFAAEFGMTPSSRSRVTAVDESNGKEDKTAKYFKRPS